MPGVLTEAREIAVARSLANIGGHDLLIFLFPKIVLLFTAMTISVRVLMCDNVQVVAHWLGWFSSCAPCLISSLSVHSLISIKSNSMVQLFVFDSLLNLKEVVLRYSTCQTYMIILDD